MKEIFTCSPLFAVTVNATGWNEAENRTGQKKWAKWQQLLSLSGLWVES